MSALEQFRSRLRGEWLIPFCQVKGLEPHGFVERSLASLCECDAADFLYAIDRELVLHRTPYFTAPLSRAKEQIFWEGRKDVTPRKISLWHEPIITIAAAARLSRDFGWDPLRIGLQSRDWGFDLVGYQDRAGAERLAVEVKKSKEELDQLLRMMSDYIRSPQALASAKKGTERNAAKKVLELQRCRYTTFWALGPNGYGFVFEVARTSSLSLVPADESLLRQ